MNRTLQIVSAYAGAQEIFDRHVPLWQNSLADLLVASPHDSPVKTNLPHLLLGRAGHHGAEANQRHIDLLKWCTRLDYDWFIDYDYDAFCLAPEIPMVPAGYQIGANLVRNEFIGNPFKAEIYLQPPILFSKMALDWVAGHAGDLPAGEEGGFFDRWIGRLLEIHPYPLYAWGPKAFSRNTIEPADLPAALAAVRNGTLFIHGVKTQHSFDQIILAYASRLGNSG